MEVGADLGRWRGVEGKRLVQAMCETLESSPFLARAGILEVRLLGSPDRQ